MDMMTVWMVLTILTIFSAIILLSRNEGYQSYCDPKYCDSKLNTAHAIQANAYNQYPQISYVDFEHKDINIPDPDLDDVQGNPNGSSVIKSTPAEYQSSCQKCIPKNKPEFNPLPAEEHHNISNEEIDYDVKNYGVTCMKLD